MKTSDLMLLGLLAFTAAIVGCLLGMTLVFALSPFWPLALVVLVAVCVGAIWHVRPHGDRDVPWTEVGQSLSAMFRPYVTRQGWAVAAGFILGVVGGAWQFGTIIWSDL